MNSMNNMHRAVIEAELIGMINIYEDLEDEIKNVNGKLELMGEDSDEEDNTPPPVLKRSRPEQSKPKINNSQRTSQQESPKQRKTDTPKFNTQPPSTSTTTKQRKPTYLHAECTTEPAGNEQISASPSKQEEVVECKRTFEKERGVLSNSSSSFCSPSPSPLLPLPSTLKETKTKEPEQRMLFDLVFTPATLKGELTLLTKITPALQVEVKRLQNCSDEDTHYWFLQVECAEHQTKWEIATFVDESSAVLHKKSRTEFSDYLLVPMDSNLSTSKHAWVETLPDVQLRAEREIWDPRARACQAHRHRFQFIVSIVDAFRNPVSLPCFSSSFRLSSSFTALDDSISDQVLKARRVVKFFNIGDDEIRDRTSATSQYIIDERDHIPPQVLGIEPKEVIITGSDLEFTRIVPPDEVQRPSFTPSTRMAGAFIKIPKTSELMMFGVRNFDDPNLCSVEYQFLPFTSLSKPAKVLSPMDMPNFDTDVFSNILELPEEFSLPFNSDHDLHDRFPDNDEMNSMFAEKCELSLVPIPAPAAGIDKDEIYKNIINGHTVASMLQGVEFRKLIKLKFGMVPALLALLSENACTLILALSLNMADQAEINQFQFKQFLDYICYPKRDVPLQPRMLFDFLQNEIGIDVRARFKKYSCLLADSMVSDADFFMDDDSSDYSPEDNENNETSDEDYEEEPPSKILRSTNSSGSRLRLAVKLDSKPIPAPLSSKEENKGGGGREGEGEGDADGDPDGTREGRGDGDGCCEWENCLLCERDIPIMLQTPNPTWAAIMRVVFYSFIYIYPNCNYWMVRDAYKYIEDHWEKLCSAKNRTAGWRKQLQDALSHNKQYFISGMDTFNKKGYWGLKQIVDPWAITDQDDHPKRAYHHQPRRGRPPKTSSVVRSQTSRRESGSYEYECLKLSSGTDNLPTPPINLLGEEK